LELLQFENYFYMHMQRKKHATRIFYKGRKGGGEGRAKLPSSPIIILSVKERILVRGRLQPRVRVEDRPNLSDALFGRFDSQTEPSGYPDIKPGSSQIEKGGHGFGRRDFALVNGGKDAKRDLRRVQLRNGILFVVYSFRLEG
jgi:hypothetical protein